jgi:hypothetical protein
MYFAHLKSNIEHLKKGGVYFFDEANAKKVGNKNATFVPLKAISQYTNQPIFFILRSGGIGDIVAMSILQNVAPKTVFLTQKKYFPILKLWQKEPIMRHFDEPLFMANNTKEFYNKLSEFGTLQGEDLIEQGYNINWYEIFSNAVGKPLIAGRPQLYKPEYFEIDACLIVSKSSTVNRSANDFELEKIALKYFNKVDIAHDQQWTTQEYLEALADYKFVISTDTSAIHIREGFQLPALGLYGAFTTESRTKYYQYTKSIDVINNCPIAPCFKHGYKPCSQNQNAPFAPCLTNYNQIETELVKYINKIEI